MKEKNIDIQRIILLGICVILLFLFMIISKNIKKKEENNTYSNINSITENKLEKIYGYNNLYYYEMDLENY